jgi:hypothetical protein
VAALAGAMPGAVDASQLATRIGSPANLAMFALFVLIFGPVPEEIGWRGHALDALQARWSALAASLLLGAAWARWGGVGPVKWARIAYGVAALWAIVGVVVLAALWQVGRLTRGLRRAERRWAPLSREGFVLRLLQAGSATGVIALLAWSAAQPYLMVSSVFPGVAR